MSQKHVEIVREMLSAFNDEDIERTPALTHAGVWTIDEGKVIGLRTFPSTGDALDAVEAPQ
jgi:hypothetical protein